MRLEPILAQIAEERSPGRVRFRHELASLEQDNLLLYLTAAGITPGAPPEQNEAAFAQMLSDTPAGQVSRALLKEVFARQRMEIAARDMEMGFAYEEGAVVGDGTPAPERDPLGAWARVSELGEGGAVLARPDGHVGYRSRGPVENAQAALAEALATILTGGDGTVRVASPQTDGLRQIATALVPSDR